MASSGLRQNVILTKYILITGGTKVSAQGDLVPGAGIPWGTMLIRVVDVICGKYFWQI